MTDLVSLKNKFSHLAKISESLTEKAEIIWRNRLVILGLFIVLCTVVAAVFGPMLITHDPFEMDFSQRFMGTSGQNFLGTDLYGRDIFSRLVLGARIAMRVATGSVVLAFIIGVPLGAFSGYYGGWLDTLIMRFMDGLLAFPGRLLAIVLVAVTGPTFTTLYIAIASNAIPSYARIVRGSVLSQKEKEYVEAARTTGESDFTVLFNEILPNCLAPVLVLTTLSFANAILAEASLSFLGVGFPPPAPSWGLMLSEARQFMETAPHMAIFPGLAIFLCILGFNLLGDGLRDIFDPRQYDR
jgi:peptide/nickel transport system permease protein